MLLFALVYQHTAHLQYTVPKLLPCCHANASLIVCRRLWMSGKCALFFSYTDTISFYYPPPHLPCYMNLAHLRQMMFRCKLCVSLICLFFPLSLSWAPSFRTVTYGRQLCREPQSVFMVSCTSSHTAAQLPTLLRAYSSLPTSGHVFCVCEILHCCCMLLSPQLLPCWRRWGELLMACGAQTEVPATACGQAYSTPSSKNTKLKQIAPFKVILGK